MQYSLTDMFDIGKDSMDDLTKYESDQVKLLNLMAIESQTVDIQCQIDLESLHEEDEYDLTDNFSVEGIAEAIKNKGSRAFYTIITLSKKALNFMFGFITNLFKSSTNVKATLKKVFEKAKKYDKELNKLISKQMPNDFEIESKNYAKRSNASLALIRSIIQMTQDAIAKANENNDDDPISRGIKLSINYSHLITVLTTDGSKVKPEDIINDITNAEGDVSKTGLLKRYTDYIKKGYDAIVKFFNPSEKEKESRMDKKESEAQLKSAAIRFKFDKDPSEYIKAIESRSEKLSNLVELYKEEPESKTVQGASLLVYYKKQLKLFLNISYKNNWDYSKSIKQLENLRAKTLKAIDKVKVDPDDQGTQKNIYAAMQMMSAMGKSMSDLTPLVKSLLSNITSDIDNLMTEIAKLGSKASKIQ